TVHYFNRSVESLPYQNPTIWSALVVIVKSRGAKTLTPDQLIVIKDQFIILDRILWAASHGAFRLNVSFFEIEKEEAQTMTRHLGRVTGPPDDLIEKRGWYDVVFCVRPRIEGEDRDALETGWSDVGPNGAALATFFSDASFSTYLRAIYQHIFNAADARGETLGWPNSAGALHCGFQPARFAGSAYRSALRYHLSPGEIAGLAIADEPVELSYLKLWRLEGPVTPVDGEPESRLDDRWPESASAASKNMVSESNFIDLAAHFENAGPAKVRATSSVFCPERRDVWVRLGRNDRASLWINGRGAIATKSIAGTKFEGRNLVDTVFTRATLEAGWNEFQLIVASRPSEKNKGWGFSVAITTPGKSAVPGLACTYETPGERLAPRYVAPAIGRHYSWKSVQADFHNLLPRLGDTELAQITSVADARLHRGEIREAPFIAVESASRKEGGAYRSPSTFDESGHHDLVLNNVLDWSREAVAAFRGGEAGRGRDLLFVRGEAIEAATSILKEHESAKGTFEGKTAADRLLGWIDFAPYGTVFVLDVRLPDEWPADEEEIFTPYGKFVPNWPDEFLEGPPYVPPVSEVPQ
ncbi:MAG TPA: hypothetical protein VNT79_02430, partial [Phycisphaerae bacterium]|nr:hypothetical protein [Phycisphaerae bacterium]